MPPPQRRMMNTKPCSRPKPYRGRGWRPRYGFWVASVQATKVAW